MLIVMEKMATTKEIAHVVDVIESQGYTARPMPGGDRVSIGILNNSGPVNSDLFIGLTGVKEAIPVTKPYKLVSRELKAEDTHIQVGDVAIGNGHLVIMAGPCAVENEKQAGAHIFCAGAYKPRTSPYTFRGLGLEGLKILAKVREAYDIPVITEVMDCETFNDVEAYADIVQIGTRNMKN